MFLPDDDELYEVDQTYLGPPQRYIGAFRYKAIFAWLVIGPLILVFERRIGVPMTLLTVGLSVIGVTAVAGYIADRATPERPVLALAATFWHELTARRAPAGSFSADAQSFSSRLHPGGPLGTWLARAKGTAPVKKEKAP